MVLGSSDAKEASSRYASGSWKDEILLVVMVAVNAAMVDSDAQSHESTLVPLRLRGCSRSHFDFAHHRAETCSYPAAYMRKRSVERMSRAVLHHWQSCSLRCPFV